MKNFDRAHESGSHAYSRSLFYEKEAVCTFAWLDSARGNKEKRM